MPGIASLDQESGSEDGIAIRKLSSDSLKKINGNEKKPISCRHHIACIELLTKCG
jgi:hypothetical protein